MSFLICNIIFIVLEYYTISKGEVYMMDKYIALFNILKDCFSVSENGVLEKPDVTREKSIVDNDNLKNNDYTDILFRTIDYIKDNVYDGYLDNFYNNINSLKLENGIEYYRTAGYYNAYYNTLNLCPINEELYAEKGYIRDSLNTVISHELFHMASTYYDKKGNICYSGFTQTYKNKTIGRGITEGYTQYLTDDYCKNDPNHLKGIPYIVEGNIIERLEDVVRKEKLKELYFKSDLLGLIKELNKYADIKEIMNFIKKVDFVYYIRRYESTEQIYGTNIYDKIIASIYNFIRITALKKLKEEVNIGLQSETRFDEKLDSFINSTEKNKYLSNREKEKLKIKALKIK